MQMNLGVPTARAAHVMCAVNKQLVIFGGKDIEARKNDIHIFNTGKVYCSSIPDMNWEMLQKSRVFAHQIEVKNKYVSVLVGLTTSSKYCKFNYIIITSPFKNKLDIKDG